MMLLQAIQVLLAYIILFIFLQDAGPQLKDAGSQLEAAEHKISGCCHCVNISGDAPEHGMDGNDDDIGSFHVRSPNA